MPSRDARHDLRVHGDQIVTAHARLARKPGGHDDDVRALDVLVAVRALELHVEAVDRRRLGDVEHLPLRQPLDDVEEDHVAELAQRAELSQHATDLPAANQCNLRSSHLHLLEWVVRCCGGAAPPAAPLLHIRDGVHDGVQRRARPHRRRRLLRSPAGSSRQCPPACPAPRSARRRSSPRSPRAASPPSRSGPAAPCPSSARRAPPPSRARGRSGCRGCRSARPCGRATCCCRGTCRSPCRASRRAAEPWGSRRRGRCARARRRARRTRRASPSAGNPPSRTAARAWARSRQRPSRRARHRRGAARPTASSRWCRSRGWGTGRSGSHAARCR